MNRSAARNALVIFGSTVIAIGQASHQAAARPSLIQVVALSSQPAPGAGGAFESFSVPAVNATGQLAFTAYVDDGAGGNARQGIWTGRPSQLSLLARAGDPAPGTTSDYYYLREPLIDDAGRVAFSASYLYDTPFPQIGSAIWRTQGSHLEIIAAMNTPSPLSDYERFQGVHEVLLTRSGKLAFTASLGPAYGVWSSMWREDGSQLVRVSRSYDRPADLLAVPELPNALLSSHASLVANSRGETALIASLQGVVDQLTHFTLWKFGDAEPQLLARSLGSTTGQKQFHYNLYEPSINDAGLVAFTALFAAPGTWQGYDGMGLWTVDAAGLQQRLASGDPIPGGQGEYFSGLSTPLINYAGVLAFAASHEGGASDSGIWKLTPSGPTAVALAGQPAPGGGQFASHGFLSSLAINARGQVAFLAREVNSLQNATGLWAEDIVGVLQCIARPGGLLEVKPGDLRTIASIDFAGGSGLEDGRRAGFNDRGQVAFVAKFTDGTSGIFISNAVAVPEPEGVLLALAASIFAMRPLRSSQRTRHDADSPAGL